jgi:small subunit ribosomal protein S16
MEENMPVVLRLRRTGSKKRPFYRVVAADSRYPRNGRFLENLGTVDPNSKTEIAKLKVEKIDEWVKKGAQCSETLASLLKTKGPAK